MSKLPSKILLMDLIVLFELINHTLFYPGFNQVHLTKDACNHENSLSLIIDSRQAIAQAAFIVPALLSKQNQAADIEFRIVAYVAYNLSALRLSISAHIARCTSVSIFTEMYMTNLIEMRNALHTESGDKFHVVQSLSENPLLVLRQALSPGRKR
jgi:hypothetical protein